MIRRVCLAAALATAVFARPADAQAVRPWLEWRTLRTEHFDVHYPAELEAWTRDVASRLDGVHAAVGALVGSVPARRVTVVVDDPAGEANGSAFSFLRTPYILLYPTPPHPRSPLGHSRGPAEQLAVHEFAHVAHLTRPSRNPFARVLSVVDPRGLGPLAQTSPRWVREGFATYVEGRLTGYGRPHGVLRAAILRQWALEGRLPTYAQLDASAGAYQMPGMAYLAGSAFLEWLVERRGEASLDHLWRRMSARRTRTFEQAFAGVYGASPRELYGLFTVEVTAGALEARRLLSAAGLAAGDTVQHLAWGTGDVALSPDGRHMAVALGGPTRAWSRLVVWRTDEPPPDSASAAEDAALLARDPDDVPPLRVWPRARRAVAVLRPAEGPLPYESPRFLPGGDALLVVRAAPIGGGATRRDLFVWSWRGGGVRRVTHGAGIRAADPLPDGERAAAVQCRAGFCGLVLVELRTGEITTLAAGTADRVFDRPRVSPDGRTIAAAMQEGGRWMLVTVPVEGGSPTVVHRTGGGSAYDPVWTRDGGALIAADEGTGIANLVRVPLAGGEPEPLTSVIGAAAAPEVDPATGGVYYLSLHAGGWDVYRIHDDGGRAAPATLPDLGPAARRPPRAPADTLPRVALPPSRPYGPGPRWTRVLPLGAASVDGAVGGLIVHNGDPVGRLALAARGAWGERGLERGAAGAAVWRGTRPALAGEVFWIEHDPSRPAGRAAPGLDARHAGAVLSAGNAWSHARNAQAWRLGASAGRLSPGDGRAGTRSLGFAGYTVSDGQRSGSGYAAASLALGGAAGRTLGETWARGTLGAAVGAGTGSLGVRGEATLGRVSGGAPRWERFTVGGTPSLLVDDAVLSQRIEQPALRRGTLEGEDLLTWRVSTSAGPLTPYLWGGSTDRGWERWIRVAGAEMAASFPALRAAAIPGARLRAGVGYTLDGPHEHQVTAYFSASYTP